MNLFLVLSNAIFGKTYTYIQAFKIFKFLYTVEENSDANAPNEIEEADDEDDKDDKKEFSCDQCPKKFKQSWKLRQHLIAHARRDEMKKYECDKCAASFISEWLLIRHAKIHTG